MGDWSRLASTAGQWWRRVYRVLEAARNEAGALAEKIVIPNVRYRRDIGSDLIDRDFELVELFGMLDPSPI